VLGDSIARALGDRSIDTKPTPNLNSIHGRDAILGSNATLDYESWLAFESLSKSRELLVKEAS